MNTNTSPNTPEKDSNPDAITGEPGSHPVATGVGAGSAGLAGAAIGTAVGGPIGGAVGAVIGAVAGGYGGKAAGEAIDPTVEDAYWSEAHSGQSFAGDNDYEDYAPAYRAGYGAYAEHGGKNASFDEAESDIQAKYEGSKATLPWDKARPASRAAWTRVAKADETQPLN